MILVAALFFLAIILVIVLHSQSAARMFMRFEDRQFQLAQLRVAAAEAVFEALRGLGADDTPGIDHTNEAWATPRTNLFPNAIRTLAVVSDENRYFNANNLAVVPEKSDARMPVEIAGEVFLASRWPDPAGAAQALKDWIDRDTEGTREASYYREARLPMQPPNSPLESPAEMAGILHALRADRSDTPEEFTILPIEGGRLTPVNLNTAGREVLKAVLGPGRAVLAEKICRHRDAHPITSLEQAIDAKTLMGLRQYLETGSRYFSVEAIAERNGKKAEIQALARRGARGEIEILRWVCR